MFALRRWWEKNAVKAGLVFLAVGTALGIYQTNGAFVSETFRFLARPFQGNTPPEKVESPYILDLQQRVVELENQNQKLRELIDYSKNSDLDITTPAAVIGRSPDNWWQQLTLNKGAADDV